MFGGSNNNNNNNDSNKDKKEAIREKMKNRIDDSRIFREIIAKLMNQLETSPRFKDQNGINIPDTQEYAGERKILYSLNDMGLKEGCVAGILTFVFLRRSPNMMRSFLENRMSRRKASGSSNFSSSSGYQLDRLPTNNSITNTTNNKKSGFSVINAIFGGLRLGLDIVASLLVAANTSIYLADKDKVAEEVVSLPLLEGKSIICDEFCTTIQEEVSAKNPELWTKTEYFPLKQVYRFAKSCERRQAYEKQLREEQGLTSMESVAIPTGGVPHDFIVPNNDDDNDFDNNNNDSRTDGSSSSSPYDFENYDDDASMTFFGDDKKTQQQWGEKMDKEKQQK